MICYKLRFHSFPEIEFAGSICTDQYKNIISNRSGMLEIGISRGPAVRWKSEEEDFLHPSESFSFVTPDCNFSMQAVGDEPMFSSFAAVKGTFSCERLNTDTIGDLHAFLEQEKDSLLIPRNFELGTCYTETERLFRLLIMNYLKETAVGRTQVIALWLEIVSYVSEQFRQSLMEGDSEAKHCEYYTQKAQKYLLAHYPEKVTTQKLARILGITPAYLSRIFRKHTGRTVTEFLTLIRLYHARLLAYQKEMTFEEIAAAVGICDIYYLNRLFHKYYGCSLYACRLTDKEISLYHEKPWEVEKLAEDIYRL